MRLWEVNEDIRNNYIFLPGELHVTFWASAALGEYIEASGIDQAWIEGGGAGGGGGGGGYILRVRSRKFCRENNITGPWKHICQLY